MAVGEGAIRVAHRKLKMGLLRWVVADRPQNFITGPVIYSLAVPLGLLDLFVVHKISRGTLLKIFPKVYTGAHVTHPAVEILRAQSVILDAGAMPAYSDGEAVGQSPIAVSIAPKALLVFAPAPPSVA